MAQGYDVIGHANCRRTDGFAAQKLFMSRHDFMFVLCMAANDVPSSSGANVEISRACM